VDALGECPREVVDFFAEVDDLPGVGEVGLQEDIIELGAFYYPYFE
jgi:hypothetical protein